MKPRRYIEQAGFKTSCAREFPEPHKDEQYREAVRFGLTREENLVARPLAHASPFEEVRVWTFKPAHWRRLSYVFFVLSYDGTAVSALDVRFEGASPAVPRGASPYRRLRP